MATQTDTVKIEINILGETLRLTVPYDRQESVRTCEREINSLYSEWRRAFPRKTHSELAAMIAYQYASYYTELQSRQNGLKSRIEDLDIQLDSILGANRGA